MSSEGLNRVMILGNIGSDPELRVTHQGTSVLNMLVATTDGWLDANNFRHERTEWHKIVMWGKRGEALSKFLKKGDRIFVEGALRTISYEKNGEKRYSTEIHASNVILSGGGRRIVDGDGDGRDEPQRRPDSPPASPPASGTSFGADPDEIPF